MTDNGGVFAPAAFWSDKGSSPPIPWEEWIENFEVYLIARGNTSTWTVERKVATLKHCLGVAGHAAYREIESMPAVGATEYEKVVFRLSKRFAVEKGLAARRMDFAARKQNQGESVREFVGALRKLAGKCMFPITADDAIITQLTVNTTSDAVREKLLNAKEGTSFEELIALATRTEINEKEAKSLGNSVNGHSMFDKTDINQVRSQRGAGYRARGSTSRRTPMLNSASCGRCGNTGHDAQSNKCPARRVECWRCRREGHYAKFCGSRNQMGVNYVDTSLEGNEASPVVGDPYEEEPTASYRSMGAINSNVQIYYLSYQPLGNQILVMADIEDRKINFLVDTGASVSILNVQDFGGKVSDLTKTPIVLKSYKGECIENLGYFRSTVRVGERVAACGFFVVRSGRSLLGCDALQALGLRIDCSRMKCEINEITEENVREKFGDLFENRLGKVLGFEHAVREKRGARPLQQKVRRLPLTVREQVREELERLETSDVIERIESSEWISALVVVSRKDGRIRLCVDLRAVNAAIVADVFPLPHFEDLLTRLGSARVFSKLDARSAYHQVELAENSRDLTAFITPWGLFRFKRVPFGLASAPAAFQRLMEQILWGIEGVIIYLDDVLIFGENEREHDDRLQAVLLAIRKAGMVLNAKCVIRVTEIEFVGYSIGAGGIRPTAGNMRAIEDLPEPRNASQIKSVLGTTSFYMRCVPNFSTIAEPLRRLLKADSPFVWGKEQGDAFKKLKNEIVNAKPLAVFDHTKETIVATDASNVGCGACLLQVHADGERPVSFASCALSDAQMKYSAGEKEALAVVFAVERWRIFLYGRRFRVRTDHQALVALLGSTTSVRASMRIARWAERLREYNFSVEYKPGANNNVPDMLSRLPTNERFQTQGDDDKVIAFLEGLLKPISYMEIAAQSESDTELINVRKWLITNNRELVKRVWWPIIAELSVENMIVMRSNRVVLPVSLRQRAIDIAHRDAHQGIVRTKQRLRQIYWWPGMDSDTELAIKNCGICSSSERTATARTAPIVTTPWPSSAWERLAVDIRGPDSSCGLQCRFAVVIIDYFSKWVEVELMAEVTAHKLVEMFRKLIHREGIPQEIVSDNGVQFISQEFTKMIEEFGIKHIKTPVYHPMSNGLCERFNRTLGGFLETAKHTGGDLRKKLVEMIGAYNSTPQATTGKSPAELIHGKRMRTKLDITNHQKEYTEEHETLRQQIAAKQLKQKIYADQRRAAKQEEYNVGDWVRTKKPQAKKGETRYNLPARIERRYGKNTFKISDGRIWHQNQFIRGKPSIGAATVRQQTVQGAPEHPVWYGSLNCFDDEENAEVVDNEQDPGEESRTGSASQPKVDRSGSNSVGGSLDADHTEAVQTINEQPEDICDEKEPDTDHITQPVDDGSMKKIERAPTRDSSAMEVEEGGLAECPSDEEFHDVETTPRAAQKAAVKKRTAEDPNTPETCIRKASHRIRKRPKYLDDYVSR
ncbi:uncharacterized protein K02A2.6-like [Galendromus occidentalis]|uniref:RNA-directed DNA polymerase n=1 Tax=Galendromus occidentalis TaxID=34638 RepID=A0AAJ6VWA0_9ACAR|nr:uncharacterized protein K02A2.6-like [Galendromus occidentalis]